MFEIAGREYGDPNPELRIEDVANETRMTLARVVKMGINRFSYVYDFGDNWEHTVLIEKRPPAVTGTDDPLILCVAGERHCPPEDCGGICGYQELVTVLANPTDPRYDEWKDIWATISIRKIFLARSLMLVSPSGWVYSQITERLDWNPWVQFLLKALDRQKSHLAAKNKSRSSSRDCKELSARPPISRASMDKWVLAK